MKKISLKYAISAMILTIIILAVLITIKKPGKAEKPIEEESQTIGDYKNSGDTDPGNSSEVIKEARSMPVYGNWRNFTTKDGLPSDKAYTVRIDDNRVLVGTHDGLAVYENDKWRTYTTKDGLAHNGVVSIDVCELTGDVWLGTLGGLNRWSAGRFETFNQLTAECQTIWFTMSLLWAGIWSLRGGAGHYDIQTRQWEIFTEMNAPMHEPWTYALSAGDGKVWIAAWGGGVIEYNTRTRHFRDYVDPDGFMEIDLQPDDGVVHDITTATSYSDSILWVSTYFGMSRYDGKNWKGYFDHDSGLASNFINFLRAEGSVVFVCCDNGLSTFNGETWVTYKKNDNDNNGKALITNDKEIKEIPLSPSIAHNFIIGVDAKDDVLWVATSKGVSRGELIK
jgi:ligand-binding sensor domain-containing protein